MQRPMRRYETSTPRAALGVAALAMTAITMIVLIAMPAAIQAGTDGTGAAPCALSRDSTERNANGSR
jgi:hypothetical protein